MTSREFAYIQRIKPLLGGRHPQLADDGGQNFR
jgi:hypothetical protein